MSNKLIAFVSAAVLSFGMSISGAHVATPVTQEAELVSLLQSAEQVGTELKGYGISEEEIIEAIKAEGKLSANNGMLAGVNMTAVLEQIGKCPAFATTPLAVGTTVATTVAVLAVAYYGVPFVWKKMLRPVGAGIGRVCGALRAQEERKKAE
jgi:hypothetical protein